MSGLLDAVADAALTDCSRPERHSLIFCDCRGRAAVEAVAAWLDGGGHGSLGAAGAEILRAEVAPPKPTPEDVIYQHARSHERTRLIVDALRDAGMLR